MMDDFPAPVAPTKAMFLPLVKLNEMSLKT